MASIRIVDTQLSVPGDLRLAKRKTLTSISPAQYSPQASRFPSKQIPGFRPI